MNRRGPAPPRASAPGARGSASPRPPGEVRLIGGQWKRSKLPVLDRPGLRPTPDRVRETLFNWLGQDLTGWRVLDAFAGSGALGFEAASRGAAEVVMLERDPALAQSLSASAARLGARVVREDGQAVQGTHVVQVRRADALAWMARAEPGHFDLVLLDPPFEGGALEPAIARARALVAPGGLLYVEAPQPVEPPPEGFEPWKALRAGAVHAHLFRRGD